MPESSKAFYTIQEAMEWIAFRKDSSEITAEYATSHQAELDKAHLLLLKSIKMRKLRLIGQVYAASRRSAPEVFMNSDLYDYLEEAQEITSFSDDTYIDPAENSLESNSLTYRNIQILTNILKKQFPPFTSQVSEEVKGYTTPYIEIMLETIREEKLSAENQSKAEALTDIIANKMAKRGLNKSEKLATAMATLIRMPESQKGRNQMG